MLGAFYRNGSFYTSAAQQIYVVVILRVLTKSIVFVIVWILVPLSQPVQAIVRDFTTVSRINHTRFTGEVTMRSNERFMQVVHALKNAHIIIISIIIIINSQCAHTLAKNNGAAQKQWIRDETKIKLNA